MRSLSRVVVVLGLSLLLAVPATAQQRQREPGQRGGFGGGFGGFGANPGFLIGQESVQKELKLDSGQIDKAQAAIEKVQEKHRDDFAKLRELSPEEGREKRMAMQRTISAETMKELEGILKPEQIKRLKQIMLQQSGVEVFTDPEVQKALKLDNAQKEKIKTIAGDATAQMGELRRGGRGGDFQEMQKKMAAMRKEHMERATAILNADQKQAWNELVGKHFEVQFQFPGRRGGQ